MWVFFFLHLVLFYGKRKLTVGSNSWIVKKELDNIESAKKDDILFHSDKVGIDLLEISPGISISHNFSGIRTSKQIQAFNMSYSVHTFDSGFMKEHFLVLPPFNWYVPLGLSEIQKELFWKQTENHWHFNDTNMNHISVVWEIINGEAAVIDRKCHSGHHSHHINACKWPRQVSNVMFNDTVVSFGGHSIDMFQHFFDNGLPHLAAAHMSTNFDIADTIPFTTASNSISIASLSRIGFNNIKAHRREEVVSASRLIIVPTVRVIHPYFFNWFTSHIKIPDTKRDKIIMLPRDSEHGGGGSRIIGNFQELINTLEKQYPKQVVVFSSKKSSNINTIINLFSTAKFIIGPHGGAFYNQFFSPQSTKIVEMIPMQESGMYPSQNQWDRNLPFAHLSMYSNTLLLGQQFYRYITFTHSLNYDIDINDFMSWFTKIYV